MENHETNHELTGKEKRKKNLLPPFNRPGGRPQSPNAHRPKGSLSLTTLLKEHLQKCDKAGKSQAEKLVASMVGHARKGTSKPLEICWDRVDGPVPQKIEIETKPLLILKSKKSDG